MTNAQKSDAMAGAAAVNAAAGSLAAGSVLVGLFPIDVAKTYMQARGATAAATATALLADGASAATVRRFYRGIGPALSEQMINRFMLFGVGSVVKRHMPATWPEPARDAASGVTAAFAKTAILHPLDTVKCRWQLGMAWSQLAGLYSGFGPASVRSSCGMAIWLSSRNHLERTLPDEGRFWSSAGRHFVSGALSSALTDLCTFPFDTLKKTMQADGAAAAETRTPLTLRSVAARLLSEGGVARFYRGYLARFVMVSVNGALFNSAFVAIKQRLEGVWADEADGAVHHHA
jgi:hypothetical protein